MKSPQINAKSENMLSTLGLEVTRTIPFSQLAGLALGTHKVYGGVIRNELGQIASHLVAGTANSFPSSLIPGLGTIGSLINAAQLYSVGRDVQQVQQTVNTVLQVSMASTALAGLGLVTSVAGFAYLNQRLNKVDAKLSQLEKQIKEIRLLVQSRQKAELHTAIDCLRQAELATNDPLRHDLLMQSKSLFTTLAHYYRELWINAGEMNEIEGVDEYFTLAFMGGALATSELGLSDVAFIEMKRHYDDWQTHARRHCDKHLLRGAPQRLMDESMVDDLPARELIDTLDFVNNTSKGIDWIDELRRLPTSLGPALQKSLPGAFQRFVAPASEKPAIEFAKRLRARDNVLSANIAHFEFLADKKISANYFASQVKEILLQNDGAAVCIYRQSASTTPPKLAS